MPSHAMSHAPCACILPSPVSPRSRAISAAPNLCDWHRASRAPPSAPPAPPIALRRRDLGGLRGAFPRPFSAGEASGVGGLLAARGAFLRGGAARRGPSPPRSLGARGSGGMHGGMRRRKRRVWSRRGEEEGDEGRGKGGEERAKDVDTLRGVFVWRGVRGGEEGGARDKGKAEREAERGAEREGGGEGGERERRRRQNEKQDAQGSRRDVPRSQKASSRGRQSKRDAREGKEEEESGPSALAGKATAGEGEKALGVRERLRRAVENGPGDLVGVVTESVIDTVKDVTDSVTESVIDTVMDVKDTVKDVKDSVEETIKSTVGDVTETVKETVKGTVKDVTETVAQVGGAVLEQARGERREEEEEEEEEDLSPMRMLLGVEEERGRKAQANLGIIQHRPSIVSLLYNLYSHMLKQPPLVFVLAVCSAPVLLSLLFTLFYLPDLDGLVVEDTLLAYLQSSVAASAASALEDESFFAAPAMAAASELATLSAAAGPGEAAAAAAAAGGGAGGAAGAVVTGIAHTAAGLRAPATAAAAAAAAKEAASGGLFNVVEGSQTLKDAVRALEESNLFRVGPAGLIPGGCAWGIFQVLMFSLSLSTGLEPALAPASPYALVVANVNALVAQLLFVFLSGAVFARLTQPVDPILCSKVACITPVLQQQQQQPSRPGPRGGESLPARFPRAARSLSRSISSANFSGSAAFAAAAAAGGGGIGGVGARGGEGEGFSAGGGVIGSGRGGQKECERMLLVRYVLAGPQPCELVDVKVELTLKHNTLSCTGRFFRQVDHLKLVRSEDSYQRYGMTVRHLIDESSPLYGRSREDLLLVNAQLSLAVIGMERASMQPVFHVEDYFVADEDIIWNADFEDMVYRDKSNRLLVDHRKISNWVAVEL
ncbi:hypothetical protein CLOP_g4987 [Closterium sp. NIES-67]|nr:hypothetical protein CLOP_g4987 [Closterium sp. NIES-67]